MDYNLPTFESASQALRPVLTQIIEALDTGVAHVRAYHDWRDTVLDRSLAPNLVRSMAKELLISAGRAVKEEEEPTAADADATDSARTGDASAVVPFTPRTLSNNGLIVETDDYVIRVLKSDMGALPPPGPSEARRHFYGQLQLRLPFPSPDTDADDAEAAPPKPKVNLVVHWTVTDEYHLVKICLACPRGGENSRTSVETQFDEVIWRPQPMLVPVFAPVGVEAPGGELDIVLDETVSDRIENKGSGE
jgi:hypothetical protein